MGQRYGRCLYDPGVVVLCNLPKRAVRSVLNAFNDTSEGFALSYNSFTSVSAGILKITDAGRMEVERALTRFYQLLDTDHNHLIDAFEYIGTLAVLSSMDRAELLKFVISFFDFDNSKRYYFPEVSLCLKLVLTGLCKICDEVPPTEIDINGFLGLLLPACTIENPVSEESLLGTLQQSAEFLSWLAYYSLEVSTDPKPCVPRSLHAPIEALPLSSDASAVVRRGRPVEQQFCEARSPGRSEEGRHALQQLDLRVTTPAFASIAFCTLRFTLNPTCVHFSPQGHLIYSSGPFIVQYNSKEGTQSILHCHKSSVTTIACFISQMIAASSEECINPKVIIWKMDSFEILESFSTPFENGISLMAFSRSGKLLLCLGEAPDSTMCVFHRSANGILMDFRTSLRVVPSSVLWKDDVWFAMAHSEGVEFHRLEAKRYSINEGVLVLPGKKKRHICLSLTPESQFLVSGTEDGELYIWEGKDLKSVVPAHTGAVRWIEGFTNGFMSCGEDAKLRLWGYGLGGMLRSGPSFSLNYIAGAIFCCKPDFTLAKIVCQSACSLREIGFDDGLPCNNSEIRGHRGHRMMLIPLQNGFITGDDSGLMMRWSEFTHQVDEELDLHATLTCSAEIKLNDAFAVGLESSAGPHIIVVSIATLKPVEGSRISLDATPTAMAADNQSKLLVVAAKSIRVFSIGEEFKSVVLYQLKNSVLRLCSLDVSEDCLFLRANTDDGLLQLYSLSDRKEVKSVPDSSNAWCSSNCLRSSETSSVSFVDPSQVSAYLAIRDFSILGTRTGSLFISTVPPGRCFSCYEGHSSSVTRVARTLSVNSQFLISQSLDCCIQWKINENQNQFAVSTLPNPRFLEYRDQFCVIKVPDPSKSPATIPKGLVLPPLANTPYSKLRPNCEMIVEWIYGYNLQGRDNVCYTSQKEIVFPAGKNVVVMNDIAWTQRYYFGHQGYILYVAVDKSSDRVASNEHKSTDLDVWDSKTAKLLNRVSLPKSPLFIRYSSNGLVIASCIEAQGYRAFLCSPLGSLYQSTVFLSMSPILDLQFLPGSSDFLFCGVNVMGLALSRGINYSVTYYSINESEIIFTRCIQFQSFLIYGTIEGTMSVLLFKGGYCIPHSVIKAHSCSITNMSCFSTILVTASIDGTIQLHSETLERIRSFSVRQFNFLSSTLRSLEIDNDTILIATSSGEIASVSATDGHLVGEKCAIAVHSSPPIVDLSIHSKKAEFLTIGGDHTLRVYNHRTRRLLNTAFFQGSLNAISYEERGNSVMLFVSQEGEERLIVMDDHTLSMDGISDTPETVCIASICTKASVGILGCVSGNLYLFPNVKPFKAEAQLKGLRSRVVSLDFSKDSQYVRACDDLGNHVVYSVRTKNKLADDQEEEGIEWSSISIPYIDTLRGLYYSYKDKGASYCLSSWTDCRIIASGDTNGMLRCYYYPIGAANCDYQEVHAHYGPVQNLKFIGEEKCITTGQCDGCIIQWRIVMHEDADENNYASIPPPVAPLQLIRWRIPEDAFKKPVAAPEDEAQVPPVLSTMPTRLRDGFLGKMDFIYGVTTSGMRNHVCYNSMGQILYPISQAIVIVDKHGTHQKRFLVHRARITAMCTDNESRVMVSGDCSGQLLVWDSYTCFLYSSLVANPPTLIALHQRYLVCYSQKESTLELWLFPGESYSRPLFLQLLSAPQSTCRIPKRLTTFLKFWGTTLVVAGHSFCEYYSLVGNTLVGVQQPFVPVGVVQPITCGDVMDERCFTGMNNGDIYEWSESGIKQIIYAYKSTILTISAVFCDRKWFLLTATKGVIKVFSSSMVIIRSMNLVEFDPKPLNTCVMSLGMDMMGTILIGTSGAEIYEMTKNGYSNLLHRSHDSRIILGLCAHPQIPDRFLTGGNDKTLRLWSPLSHCANVILPIDGSCSSITWSKSGKSVVIGLGDKLEGYFLFLEGETFSITHKGKDTDKAIVNAAVSPADDTFLLCSLNSQVFLYNTEDFSIRWKTQVPSPVHFCDYSENGEYLRMNTERDLVYYSVSDGHMTMDPGVSWATKNCIFDPGLEGIARETDFHCVDICEAIGAVVVGGDFGVRLFPYPCFSEAECVQIADDSNPVARLRFSSDGSFLMGVGALDGVIYQWRIATGL